jgi:hypothetical protein
VLCPACDADVTELWKDWMEQATDLNSVVYEWPAGLARFVMEVKNPGSGWMDRESHQRLEAILGCGLRQTLQRL